MVFPKHSVEGAGFTEQIPLSVVNADRTNGCGLQQCFDPLCNQVGIDLTGDRGDRGQNLAIKRMLSDLPHEHSVDFDKVHIELL